MSGTILHHRQKGIALIFVVGMLSLISLIAAVLTRSASMEQQAARNFVDQTYARMLAETGIEETISRLRDNGPQFPLSELPMFMPVAGEPVVPGRVVGGAYRAQGDYYQITVQDLSGRLCVNDSNAPWNVDSDAFPDYHWEDIHGDGILELRDAEEAHAPRRLTQMFLVLTAHATGEYGAYPDCPRAEEAAQAFESARSLGRIRDAGQMHEILDGILSPDECESLLDWICFDQWRDPNVIRPTFKVEIPWGAEEPGFAAFYVDPEAFPIYRYSDFQTRHFELEPRSPININTASQKVLTAMLLPLQGWFLFERSDERDMLAELYGHWNTPQLTGLVDIPRFDFLDETMAGYNTHYGTIRKTRHFSAMQAQDLAKCITERARLRPFTTWQEFELWLRGRLDDFNVPDSSVFYGSYSDEIDHLAAGRTERRDWWNAYFARVQQDLVIAAFNPNSRLNDYNPNTTEYLCVDKAQLIAYATEGCLNCLGGFQIRSTGVVTAGDVQRPELIAQCILDVGVQCFTWIRLTSQAQFLAGVRPEHPLSEFLSENPENNSLPTRGGLTLQAYPQPLVHVPGTAVPGDPLPGGGSDLRYDWLRSAVGDGSIAPAVLEIPKSVQAKPQTTFCANFSVDLNPEKYAWGGADTRQMYIQDDSSTFVGGRNHPFAGELMGNQRNPIGESTKHLEFPALLADGGFSEAGRVLAYSNFSLAGSLGQYGMLGFWMKRNYDPGLSSCMRKIVAFWQRPPREEWVDAGGNAWTVEHKSSPAMGCWEFPNTSPSAPLLSGNVLWPAATEPYLLYQRGHRVPFQNHGWMTTHSLVFGSRLDLQDPMDPTLSKKMGAVNVISSITTDYPDYAVNYGAANRESIQDRVNARAHAWDCVLLSWDLRSGLQGGGMRDSTQHCCIALQGRLPVTEDLAGTYQYQFNVNRGVDDVKFACRYVPGLPESEYQAMGGVQNAFVRFGELPMSPANVGMADCTVANIFMAIPEMRGNVPPHVELSRWLMGDFGAFHHNGRYWRNPIDSQETIGVYQSPAIDIEALVGARGSYRLLSVAWTAYLPINDRNPVTRRLEPPRQIASDRNPTESDPLERATYLHDGVAEILAIGDPIQVDLFDSTANQGQGEWLWTADRKDEMPSTAGGTPLNRQSSAAWRIHPGHGAPLQFRVYFNGCSNDTTLPSSNTEMTVLDDISFAVCSAAPRVYSWRIIQ